MIGWEFPPLMSGGLGVASQGLAHGLLAEGERLVFAVPQPLPMGISYRRQYRRSPHGRFEMIQINAQLSPYPARDTVGRIDPAFATDLVSETQKYGQGVRGWVQQYTPRRTPKLVHAHDWLSIPAAVQAREKLRRPLVLQIHSTEYDRAGGGVPNAQIAEIEWQGLTAADKIVAVSQYTKAMIMEKYGISADKIEVVHNGIDPNPEYHDKPLPEFLANRPVVVFMGRLTIQKGPEYFLAVAKRVIEQEPQAVFVLAGDGDMYQSLLVSAASQGLSGSVLFAGFLRDKEKHALYQRSTVFVMPSVSEPFGIAALEAALAETPVIVSKNAGVLEVLPHAIAIDFYDISSMTEEIIKCIRQPRYRKTQAQQVRQEAQQLGWQKMAQQMQKIYQGLLK